MSTFATYVLLGAAIGIALASALGVLVMNDALQRLHYVSPTATLGALLIGAALAVEDLQLAVISKGLLIVVLLFGTNAVVAHATGRALYLRRQEPPEPAEERGP
jgi:monovalent cation/proton antiporter MnhG/PhaG subunit